MAFGIAEKIDHVVLQEERFEDIKMVIREHALIEELRIKKQIK